MSAPPNHLLGIMYSSTAFGSIVQSRRATPSTDSNHRRVVNMDRLAFQSSEMM